MVWVCEYVVSVFNILNEIETVSKFSMHVLMAKRIESKVEKNGDEVTTTMNCILCFVLEWVELDRFWSHKMQGFNGDCYKKNNLMSTKLQRHTYAVHLSCSSVCVTFNWCKNSIENSKWNAMSFPVKYGSQSSSSKWNSNKMNIELYLFFFEPKNNIFRNTFFLIENILGASFWQQYSTILRSIDLTRGIWVWNV